MARFIIRGALVICAILIALFFFEILLRIFTPEPENLAKLKSSSLFLHENKPNAVFPYTSLGEFDNRISLNSYGFRDDEFIFDKKSNTFRIAVLGDSQEEALQVSLYDTWQKVMARRLTEEINKKVENLEKIQRIESYNFGISGYGTDQQWLTLREKVWQFKPDMVILAFSPNDVGDTYKNKLVREQRGKLEVVPPRDRMGGNWLGKIVRETYTYHLVIRASSSNELAKRIVNKIRTKILGFPKDERFFLSDAQLVQGPFEVIASQKNPPREVVDTWELIRALISDMKRQTGEHGAKFLITINIPRAQVQPSDWEFLRNTYHLDPNESSPYIINDEMAKIAKDLSINFYDGRLDAISWFGEKGDLHYSRDAHFNKNGNLFMGTKVADFLIEKKMIPN